MSSLKDILLEYWLLIVVLGFVIRELLVYLNYRQNKIEFQSRQKNRKFWGRFIIGTTVFYVTWIQLLRVAKSELMKYFSYGSNMSFKRIKKRVPSVKFVGVYTLSQHLLKFHKSSKDGSGKCDAYFTGNGVDKVMGVLYEIESDDKQNLNKAEGLGYGYTKKQVEVLGSSGDKVQAITYIATNINGKLKPYSWYKKHVLVGAIEAGLPPDYITLIESFKDIEDPDKNREVRELALHS